jgi:hypothetical protein
MLRALAIDFVVVEIVLWIEQGISSPPVTKGGFVFIHWPESMQEKIRRC